MKKYFSLTNIYTCSSMDVDMMTCVIPAVRSQFFKVFLHKHVDKHECTLLCADTQYVAGIPDRWQCKTVKLGGAEGVKLHSRDSRARTHTRSLIQTHPTAWLTSVDSLTELECR